MADFALWASAAEKDNTWTDQGTFLHYYERNRNKASRMAVDSDLVGSSVLSLMILEDGKWRGTASELIEKLCEIVPERSQKTKLWPKAPNILSARLRRAATFLRTMGVDIDFPDRTNKKREIVIQTKKGYEIPERVTMKAKGDDPIPKTITSIVTENTKDIQDVKEK